MPLHLLHGTSILPAHLARRDRQGARHVRHDLVGGRADLQVHGVVRCRGRQAGQQGGHAQGHLQLQLGVVQTGWAGQLHPSSPRRLCLSCLLPSRCPSSSPYSYTTSTVCPSEFLMVGLMTGKLGSGAVVGRPPGKASEDTWRWHGR